MAAVCFYSFALGGPLGADPSLRATLGWLVERRPVLVVNCSGPTWEVQACLSNGSLRSGLDCRALLGPSWRELLGCGPMDTRCIRPNCPWVSRFSGLGPSVTPCSSPEASSDGKEHRNSLSRVEHIRNSQS